jgi:hypothetical protein
MDEQALNDSVELASKIARLVQERGWNQEDFKNATRLNRHTIRQILVEGGMRKLRNATIGSCAKALGLSVHDLRTLPLERLLPRMNRQVQELTSQSDSLRRLYEKATQPELLAWIDRNPDRARKLTAEEIEELLAVQGDDGPLVAVGVETFVKRLERRRGLVQKINAIASTEYLDLLEQLIGLIYDKVKPNRD